MARFKQVYEVHGRWSGWEQPVRRGYKLACCDCGLVHDVNFRLVRRDRSGARVIQFQAARNNRSTAMIRRHRKAKKVKPRG